MGDTRCNNVSSCSAYLIWRNYAIGTGAVSLVPFIGHFVDETWLPLITLAFSFSLFAFVGRNRRSRTESCMIVPYISARALLLFTFLSAVFVLLHRYVPNVFLLRFYYGLPYVAMLVLAPVMMLVAFVMTKRKLSNTICADCLLRNGTPQERSLLGHIYFKENEFLIPRLLKIYTVLTLLLWCLYGVRRFREESSLDEFVFVYLPIAAFVIDNVALRLRYLMVGVYYRKKSISENLPFDGNFKLVRILVVSKTGVYFSQSKTAGEIDTPFEFYEEFSESLSKGAAMQYMSGVLEAVPDVRFCYGSMDLKNKRCLEHYFCFVDNESALDGYELRSGVKGKWWTKQALQMEFSRGFSRIVCAEFHRIYTVMQTSKLYTINGDRRINVKGYIPSFEIEELRSTDVNFSDNRWMILSKFNKDLSFRRLRSVWYRYIEGLN